MIIHANIAIVKAEEKAERIFNSIMASSKEKEPVPIFKTKSFWYPSFLKYSKNLEEYILFNPQHELSYVGEIE
jgi:hypothetical protein